MGKVATAPFHWIGTQAPQFPAQHASRNYASRERLRLRMRRSMRERRPEFDGGLRAGMGSRSAWQRALCWMVLAAQWVALAGYAQQPLEAPPALRAPDVRYEPSGTEVVQAMLRLGKVTARDVVYDLGCGDGRIVIAAVRERGARGVCVDIDPQRIVESRENARAAGVTDRIEFRNEDLFTTPISDATVVMLFLYPDLNLKLRPKLWSDLKPGTRVVSHWHDMGDWKPLETVRVVSGGRERPIYFWTIPGR